MKSLAYVLLIAVCFATDLISDLFIRTREIAGVDPSGWDFITTVGVIFAGIMLVLDRDKA